MSKCLVCKTEISLRAETYSMIKCEKCEKMCHQKCCGLDKTLLSSIVQCKNLSWSCDSCTEDGGILKKILEKMSEIDKKISENENKWQENKNMISEIKTQIQNGSNSIQISGKRKWSEIVAYNTPLSSRNNQQTGEFNSGSTAKRMRTLTDNAPKNNDNVLIVKAKADADKPNIENKIKSALNPAVDEVKNLRKTANGSIVVTFKKNVKIDTAKQKLETKIGEKFDVNEPKIFDPIIKVVGFESEFLDKANLIAAIRAQNKDMFDITSTIEVLNCNKMRNKDTCIATIKIDLLSFKKALKSQRINIGWSRCRIYEHVDVLRCYKCNSFGHTQVNCVSDNFSCPLCAGEHTIQYCTADPLSHKCINCIRENEKTKFNADVQHCAFSTKCPILLRKIEKRKMRIRYEK